MSLEEQIKKILDSFEETHSETMISTLDEILTYFKSNFTREYLQGKIDAINNSPSEAEKKALCKNLLPYLDWYLQGL